MSGEQLAMFSIETDAARRTRRFLLISTTTTAIVVGLVAAMVFSFSQDPGPTPTKAQPAMTQTSVQDNGPSAPLNPTTLKWIRLRNQALPVSKAGPHESQGGRVWGFDQSPEGAVLAAFHLPFRVGANSGPDVFRATLATQVTGPDREKFAATIEADYALEADAIEATNNQKTNAAAPQGPDNAIGYRLDSFTPTQAVIQILLGTGPNPKGIVFLNFTYSLRWLDGDWRLVAPFNGSWQSILVGFTTLPSDYNMLQS